jgi:hypothetical protein
MEVCVERGEVGEGSYWCKGKGRGGMIVRRVLKVVELCRSGDITESVEGERK